MNPSLIEPLGFVPRSSKPTDGITTSIASLGESLATPPVFAGSQPSSHSHLRPVQYQSPIVILLLEVRAVTLSGLSHLTSLFNFGGPLGIEAPHEPGAQKDYVPVHPFHKLKTGSNSPTT